MNFQKLFEKDFNPKEFDKVLRKAGLSIKFPEGWMYTSMERNHYFDHCNNDSNGIYNGASTTNCLTINPPTTSLSGVGFQSSPQKQYLLINYAHKEKDIKISVKVQETELLYLTYGHKMYLEDFVDSTDPKIKYDATVWRTVFVHHTERHVTNRILFSTNLHFEITLEYPDGTELLVDEMPKVKVLQNVNNAHL